MLFFLITIFGWQMQA